MPHLSVLILRDTIFLRQYVIIIYYAAASFNWRSSSYRLYWTHWDNTANIDYLLTTSLIYLTLRAKQAMIFLLEVYFPIGASAARGQ